MLTSSGAIDLHDNLAVYLRLQSRFAESQFTESHVALIRTEFLQIFLSTDDDVTARVIIARS